MNSLLFVVLALASPFAPQTKDQPPAPVVIFPAAPIPAPVPPTPGAATKLGTDQLFVFRSNAKCIVLASPQGIVKVSNDPGPLRIRAKFTDGDGNYQTKNYVEKYVFTVEGVMQGQVELIIVPEGATDADVIRKPLEVTSGPAPPTPVPVPTDPFFQALSAAFAKETAADRPKAMQLGALYEAFVVVADDPSLTTAKGLHDQLKATREKMVCADKTIFGQSLPNVRAAITAEENRVLPTAAGSPLDAATRLLCKQTFTRIANSLEALK